MQTLLPVMQNTFKTSRTTQKKQGAYFKAKQNGFYQLRSKRRPFSGMNVFIKFTNVESGKDTFEVDSLKTPS